MQSTKACWTSFQKIQIGPDGTFVLGSSPLQITTFWCWGAQKLFPAAMPS